MGLIAAATAYGANYWEIFKGFHSGLYPVLVFGGWKNTLVFFFPLLFSSLNNPGCPTRSRRSCWEEFARQY